MAVTRKLHVQQAESLLLRPVQGMNFEGLFVCKYRREQEKRVNAVL